MYSAMRIGSALCCGSLLVACGGGGGGDNSGGELAGKQTTYAISGSVTGLGTASLNLASTNSSSGSTETLTVLGTGATEVRFSFVTTFPTQARYTISVIAPFPNNLGCSVQNGSGEVTSSAITNVRVNCQPNTYTVSGTVTNLLGTGLRLLNNGGDQITVQPGSSASFTFPTALSGSTGYAVTVQQNPASPTQTCLPISNATGSSSSVNVTNVVIICTTNSYTVGGTITGLTGSGLQLRNNGDDAINVSPGTTTFTFSNPIASGATFNVTTAGTIENPLQTCAVSPATASGTVGGANVTNVAVTCITTTFSVGGSVSGLTGTGLRLRNNGGDELLVAGNGAFEFPARVPSGNAYAVTVQTQPKSPRQVCLLSGATGNVLNTSIQSVRVNCIGNISRFAYLVNRQTRTISQFNVNDISGSLSPMPVSAVSVPHDADLSAFNYPARRLYVVSSSAQTLTPYAVDSGSGDLLPQAAISIGIATPHSIGVNSQGTLLYVVGRRSFVVQTPNPVPVVVYLNEVERYSLDSAGTPAFLDVRTVFGSNSPSSLISGFFLEPGNRFAYLWSPYLNSLHSFGLSSSGALETSVQMASILVADSMAFEPSGTYAYISRLATDSIEQYSIGVDGALTLNGGGAIAGDGVNKMVIDATGRFLYALNSNDATISQFSIGANGILTSLSPSSLTTNSSPAVIAIDNSNRFIYVTDLTSGTISQYVIGDNGALTAGGTATAIANGSPINMFMVAD